MFHFGVFELNTPVAEDLTDLSSYPLPVNYDQIFIMNYIRTLQIIMKIIFVHHRLSESTLFINGTTSAFGILLKYMMCAQVFIYGLTERMKSRRTLQIASTNL